MVVGHPIYLRQISGKPGKMPEKISGKPGKTPEKISGKPERLFVIY